MSGPPRRLLDYRRLAQRNLPGLLRYKFLHDYGYDKGAVLVEAIVADICELLRRYYRRDGDLEPGQLIYPAPDRNERAGRGKTMAATRLVPVRLTIVADERATRSWVRAMDSTTGESAGRFRWFAPAPRRGRAPRRRDLRRV